MNTEIQNADECPQCGESAVTFGLELQRFPYSVDGVEVQLEAKIPVGSCSVCKARFTDERAEILRHEAVCKHLGVYTPTEIVALRKRLGLSRSALAEITKIGEASLARWERGAVIQNGAMNQFLRLLDEEGNINKLRAWKARSEVKAQTAAPVSALVYKFPALAGRMEVVAIESAQFVLNRKTG